MPGLAGDELFAGRWLAQGVKPLLPQVGFELHLVKPISPWEVARSIQQLLERPAP